MAAAQAAMPVLFAPAGKCGFHYGNGKRIKLVVPSHEANCALYSAA